MTAKVGLLRPVRPEAEYNEFRQGEDKREIGREKNRKRRFFLGTDETDYGIKLCSNNKQEK